MFPLIPEEISIEIQDEIPETKSETKSETNNKFFDPKLDLSNYKHPSLDLLKDYGDGTIKIDQDELDSNKNKIVETLKNYNIGDEMFEISKKSLELQEKFKGFNEQFFSV